MKKSLFLVAACLPATALAGDIAATAKVGTLGYGADIIMRLADTTYLRVGASGYNLYADESRSGVDYDAKFRLQAASLVGDMFPIQDSVFRLSLGVFYNNNKLEMTARPRAGNTYEINGQTYTSAQIGTLSGELTFRRVAPYIGVGWGNAFAKPYGWSFSLDVGGMYQGVPNYRLTSNSALCDAACQADIDAERADAERDLREYRWFPIVFAGATYRF